MAEIINRRMGRTRNPNKKVYAMKETPRTGRPQIYSDEIASFICINLMQGKSLTAICKDKRMPTLPTVYSWLDDKGRKFRVDFFKSYITAREIQAATFADQILDISDDEKIDINRCRLMIDSRKWIAAHLLPRKFSDRMQLTGADDQQLIPKNTQVIVNFVKSKKSEEPEQNETN
jgi:hypothetical protein